MSIGLTKDGWPKKLMFLKPFVDSPSISNLKFVFTILNFSRGWELNKNDWLKVAPDYKSITDKPKGNYIIPSGYLNKFCKEFDLYSEQPAFSKDSVYLSCKAGPHGPATSTAHQSLLLYNYDEMQNILNLTDKAGQDFFCASYTYAFENMIKPYKKGEIYFPYKGKISFIKDPEAKLRLIAISDYYTQLYLKPIHDRILFLLSKFSSDRTFTQDPMHKWDYTNQEQFWSLDLSSATDRFPIKLQKRLLARIFNMKMAESWNSILSNRTFITPDETVVSYSTGQPMGTYSSWAVFTLTHHFVVYYCAQLNGLKNFNQYMILGDDIVIKNDKVAKTYINIMNSLGVDISLNKTHVSFDTYEFAKRWIKPLDNLELTGLPVKGIFSNFKNPYIVFTILYDYFKIKENIYLSDLSLVSLVTKLYYKLSFLEFNKKSYEILKNKRGQKFISGLSSKNKRKIFFKQRFLSINRKVYNKLQNFSLALDINFNSYSYDKLRKLFCYKVKNDEYVIPGEREALLEYKRILVTGMAKVVGNMNKNIIALPKKFLDKFPNENKNDLVINPLFISVYNVLKRMWSYVDEYKSNSDLCLHSLSKKVTDINIDSLFNKDRNKVQSLLLIGKILDSGFNEINKTTEIYYGSSWTESTFTAPYDMLRHMQTSFNLSEFDQVLKGEWTKPRTAEDYISMWEKLV
jgi:hypothetical protein